MKFRVIKCRTRSWTSPCSPSHSTHWDGKGVSCRSARQRLIICWSSNLTSTRHRRGRIRNRYRIATRFRTSIYNRVPHHKIASRGNLTDSRETVGVCRVWVRLNTRWSRSSWWRLLRIVRMGRHRGLMLVTKNRVSTQRMSPCEGGITFCGDKIPPNKGVRMAIVRSPKTRSTDSEFIVIQYRIKSSSRIQW